MTAEEILIYSDGSTHTAYSSCGDYGCTMAVLRAVGVSEHHAATMQPADIDGLELGEGDVTVTVVSLEESDSCEWCAACGEFIRHGIRYQFGEGGCEHPVDEYGDVIDPEDQDSPHINLRDHPAMADFR